MHGPGSRSPLFPRAPSARSLVSYPQSDCALSPRSSIRGWRRRTATGRCCQRSIQRPQYEPPVQGVCGSFDLILGADMFGSSHQRDNGTAAEAVRGFLATLSMRLRPGGVFRGVCSSGCVGLALLAPALALSAETSGRALEMELRRASISIFQQAGLPSWCYESVASDWPFTLVCITSKGSL